MLSTLLIAFAILAVCVVIHTIGMVLIAEWLLGKRELFRDRSALLRETIMLVSVFALVIGLHILSTCIWAGFYRVLGLFSNFETALYFSVGSYTTIGYGDVVLPERWRLLGGIEGLNGVLLCGISTAFIFVIVNAIVQYRRERIDGDR
ncbi:MAG TPA: ion channel [Pyrinomonadaceae bacterium]|nr:ion channel [Pyrinomonadaceae bacterium]